MKALVTGGSGFLGAHLVEALLRAKIDVAVYDLAEPPFGQQEVTYFHEDILDLEALNKAYQGCDLAFHTAAIANIDDTRKKPIETMEVNVVGTSKCLQAATQANMKRFLFASTIYVAGSMGSFYRISKQAGEQLCKTFYEEFGLPYTVVRYGSLYGTKANEWNMIYKICRDILTKGEYAYYGTGEEVREFIHIEDAARGTVQVSLNPDFIGKAVLITGHQRMKMRELFELVREIMGNRAKFSYLQNDEHVHYKTTPYLFEPDIPLRVNMEHYVDISEGVLGCLKEVEKELRSS